VFDRCALLAPNAKLLEGYGITECSPVVSVNPPEAPRPGTIGRPLPGVELCVVDLESDAALPPEQQGMLLVSGPIVFPGYIGDAASPFAERDGRRWYVTGDLARLDADGYIHFAGRLKRFLKAGGEMVSLPALEDPLAKKYPPTKDGPQVAVEGVELEGGKPRVALFTTLPLTLDEANDLLEAAGFRGVMRLTEVRRVDRIPQLGTGKTDYKELRKVLLEQ
jgi:long-chain-fatty-acid--[acyl-carrier-protein] ligase